MGPRLFRFKDSRHGPLAPFGEERAGVYSAGSPRSLVAAEALAEEGLIEWIDPPLPADSLLALPADTEPTIERPRGPRQKAKKGRR